MKQREKNFLKRKKLSTIIMGLGIALLGTGIPFLIPFINPDVVFSIDGTSLVLLFLFSSPVMGYYIGDIISSEEDNQLNIKSAGFAFCGIFIGFIIVIAILIGINFSNQDDQFNSLIVFGGIGILIAFIIFLANYNEFIKKQRLISEEKFKNALSIAGLIGCFQYLSFSYIAPILQAPNEISWWLFVIYLFIALILGLILLREIYGLIPEFIIAYVGDYIKNYKNSKKN